MQTKRGHTLLEVTLASALLGVTIFVALEFLGQMSDAHGLTVARTEMQRRLQFGLDQIVSDLKETNPGKVQIHDFTDGPGNASQTAIVFPTARDQNGQFIFTAGGAVQLEPVWQGVAVLAFYGPTAGEPGMLCRYVDYGSHNYSNDITVTSLTATQITLSDGTVFQRSLVGQSGNQIGTVLAPHFAQLVRDPAPPAAVVWPLCLKLTAQKAMRELGGESITVVSSTGVMARNEN